MVKAVSLRLAARKSQPSGRHRSEGANKVSEEKEGDDNYAFVLDAKSINGRSSNSSSGVVVLEVCS